MCDFFLPVKATAQVQTWQLPIHKYMEIVWVEKDWTMGLPPHGNIVWMQNQNTVTCTVSLQECVFCFPNFSGTEYQVDEVLSDK